MSLKSENKRIAKNTLLLYLRMLFKTFVAFYTSRVILEALGVEDFGIYNVVAGVVALFAFVNSSMAISVQRYLSYDIGKNGEGGQQSTIYSMAIIIHVIIALMLIVICEGVGKILFDHYLNIPENRYHAAYILFHWSILTCSMSFIQVPFIALLIAYEKMNVYAYIGIIEVMLRLVIVYVLTWCSFDRLPFYGLLLFLSALLVTILYIYYCHIKIKDVRYNKVWKGKIFKDLSSFASWSALGELAWAGTGQGVNILLNIFFSPIVNAARAIAIQVITGLNQFVMSFQTAINPQIIKSYASNDKERMMLLTNKGILYSFYLLLLIGLPVILNIDYILNLWLKTPPTHCSEFCTMAIIGAMVDCMSNLLATVAKAHGKIRNYQISVSVALFLNFPLSYIALKMGASPIAVYVIYIGVSTSLIILRLYLLHIMVDYDIKLYCKTVLVRIIYVCIVSVPLSLLVRNQMNEGWRTVLLSSLGTILLVILTIYVLGITKNERCLINEKLKFTKGKWQK